jgi:transposase
VEKIPRKIKGLVTRDWIQGLHRDRLAKKNGIGYGTVTKIINEAREEKEYHDIELFRHLASVLNENGLEAAHVALAIRLKKIMEENDMIWINSMIYYQISPLIASDTIYLLLL